MMLRTIEKKGKKKKKTGKREDSEPEMGCNLIRGS